MKESRSYHLGRRSFSGLAAGLDAFPIAGAVLNGIRAKGVYEYYSYDVHRRRGVR